MSFNNQNYNQLGEEVLFNLQPSVSTVTDQIDSPVSIEQSTDMSAQSGEGIGVAVIGGLVILYLISRL